jgi:hypothetical protein|nr:hypothetical protein [uncultured Flavobacterium sp.]
MKLSKTFYLAIGMLFTIDFVYSIFDTNATHELFIWDVNIWFYRLYRFLIAILFINLYFEKKKTDELVAK